MPGQVIVGIDEKPASPQLTEPVDYTGKLICAALTSPLSRGTYDHQVGMPLAETVTSASGGSRWSIWLRDGVTWPDGSGVGARHVVEAVERIAMRPRSRIHRLVHAATGGIRAEVRDGAVALELGRRSYLVPELLSLSAFGPKMRTGEQTWEVCGPYEPVEDPEEHADDIVLRLRTGALVGPGAPALIRFALWPLIGDALAAVDRGALDIAPATNVGPEEVLGADRVWLSAAISLFGSLELGSRTPRALAEPALRRALSGLVDRERLCAPLAPVLLPNADNTRWCTGQPTSQPAVPRADTVRLRRCLADLEDPVIEYADFVPNGQVVAGLAEQLSGALGIGLAVRPISYRDYIRRLVDRDHLFLYSLGMPDIPHPAGLLLPWSTRGSPGRRTASGDPELDHRIDEALTTCDPERAETAWQRADECWLRGMPSIPLTQTVAHAAVGSRVKHAVLTREGLVDMSGMEIAHDERQREMSCPHPR